MKKECETREKTRFLDKVRAKIGSSWEDDVKGIAKNKTKLRAKLVSLGISPQEAVSISEENASIKRLLNRVGFRLQRLGGGQREQDREKERGERVRQEQEREEHDKLREQEREEREKRDTTPGKPKGGHLRKVVHHRNQAGTQHFSKKFIANQMENVFRGRHPGEDMEDTFGEDWAYQVDDTLTAEENVREMERNIREYARVAAPQPPRTIHQHEKAREQRQKAREQGEEPSLKIGSHGTRYRFGKDEDEKHQAWEEKEHELRKKDAEEERLARIDAKAGTQRVLFPKKEPPAAQRQRPKPAGAYEYDPNEKRFREKTP